MTTAHMNFSDINVLNETFFLDDGQRLSRLALLDDPSIRTWYISLFRNNTTSAKQFLQQIHQYKPELLEHYFQYMATMKNSYLYYLYLGVGLDHLSHMKTPITSLSESFQTLLSDLLQELHQQGEEKMVLSFFGNAYLWYKALEMNLIRDPNVYSSTLRNIKPHQDAHYGYIMMFYLNNPPRNKDEEDWLMSAQLLNSPFLSKNELTLSYDLIV